MFESILPKEKIDSLFDVSVTFDEYRMGDLNRIIAKQQNCINGMLLSIWDRIFSSGKLHVDPQAMAGYTESPKLHQKMSKLLKKKLVYNILLSYGNLKDDSLSDKQVSQLCIAHIFPNYLHLADIYLQNPYKPLKVQKFYDAPYEGLGLLADVMQNIIELAEKKKCEKVTLVAARREQISLFEKYGFNISETYAAEFALKHGVSIPMEISI